jgi:DNA-binding XRE family transcriptional regulator
MYDGQPEARAAIRPLLVEWLSGAALTPEEEQKFQQLIERQLLEEKNEIKRLRISCGLKSAEAAKRLGVRRQTLHVWEHRPVTDERLQACLAAWTHKSG